MKRRNEFHWNVMVWNVNRDELDSYDVGPCFVREYKELKKKERVGLDVDKFLDRTARYYFWAKCEYEMVCAGWPKFKNERKFDVYEQLKVNWDNFVDAFARSVKIENRPQ